MVVDHAPNCVGQVLTTSNPHRFCSFSHVASFWLLFANNKEADYDYSWEFVWTNGMTNFLQYHVNQCI